MNRKKVNRAKRAGIESKYELKKDKEKEERQVKESKSRFKDKKAVDSNIGRQSTQKQEGSQLKGVEGREKKYR